MTMLRTGSSGSCASLDGDVDIDRDRDLVLLAQEGDRGAFNELYALYHRRLWRFCFKRLQDEHEAEDVVQESFLRAWRALPGFAGERRFYPWLSVIASHLCTNVVRKRNRTDPSGDLHDQEAISWEHCGEDHVLAVYESKLAGRALARLSPRHRLILDLREGRGWSYRRIAEHQGIGVPAVESLLWRAREALKREFASQEGEGRLAGVAGAALLTLRRWLRAPQVAAQQGAASFPATTSAIMGSAAAAVTAVAVGVGTLLPTLAPAGTPPALVSSTPVATLLSGVQYPPLATSTGASAWELSPGPVGTVSAGATASGVTAPGTAPSLRETSGEPSANLVPNTDPSAPSPQEPSISVDAQVPSQPQAPTPTVSTTPPSLPSAPPTVSNTPVPSPTLLVTPSDPTSSVTSVTGDVQTLSSGTGGVVTLSQT